MRRQGEQTARGLVEQSRTMQELTAGSQNITKKMALLTRANREYAAGVAQLHTQLRSMRQANVEKTEANPASSSATPPAAPRKRARTRTVPPVAE
jgi:hypothetical protein